MYDIFGTHIKEEKIVRPGTDQTRQGGIGPTRHTSPGKCGPLCRATPNFSFDYFI